MRRKVTLVLDGNGTNKAVVVITSFRKNIIILYSGLACYQVSLFYINITLPINVSNIAFVGISTILPVAIDNYEKAAKRTKTTRG